MSTTTNKNTNKNTTTNKNTNTIKLSDVKKACRNVASFNNDLTLASADDAKIVKQLKKDIEHKNFNVVCKDSTSCAFFIVDDNKNTVCNVYDTLRIQFTTVQAKKYRDALMKDSKNRFYEHIYHNNAFISCKCSTYTELLDAFTFIYNNVYNVKATVTENTTQAKKAK